MNISDFNVPKSRSEVLPQKNEESKNDIHGNTPAFSEAGDKKDEMGKNDLSTL